MHLTRLNGTWKKRIAPTLTEEEIALQAANLTPANRPQKAALFESLRARSLQDAPEAEAAQAEAVFVAKFPEGATLIAADMFFPEGTGIINCRVDGEHVQIRF